MGLNDSYSAIHGQILLMNPLPSIHQAYSSISQEEKQRLLSSTLTGDCSGSSAAMAIRHSNSRRIGNFNAGTGKPEQFHHSYGSHDFKSQEKSPENTSGERRFQHDRRRSGGGRGHLYCSHCGERGHWIQTCYELHGYPPVHPKTRYGSGSKHFITKNLVAKHVSKEASPEDGQPLIGIS